ncbi:HlyD family secretion protein [Hymenobacter sp. IS2118]|uniref:HlyD family secretion protein n=1 Tax=Hymenobacter sp. IS2118 TaxID=1505605 RepID=UPI0013788987|nr:HlyD family secretion protein [Hymenobacter sp. IS2118]
MLPLAALSLAALLTGCGGEETDNAQVQADISPVIPKVPGTVREVRVADNQRVQRGDTLVLLDDRDFALRVQQATIALAQAEANVTMARQNRQAADQGVGAVASNSAAAQAGIAAAQAGVETARVRTLQARQNLDRQSALLAQQSTTQQAYDNVKADYDATQAGLAAARAQVQVLSRQAAAARQQVGSTRTEAATAGTGIALAELAVEQARAALATARLQASYTALLAPAAGVVSDKSVQLGQVVNPGQTLLKVANDAQLWVVANFKETQLEGMKVGQPVEIKADAYDREFAGKIQSFAPATGARFSLLPPDNATGNFVKVTQRVPVKIAFTEAPDAKTRCGRA